MTLLYGVKMDFSELFNSSVLIFPYKEDDEYKIELPEEKAGYFVTIMGVPADCMAIKADKFHLGKDLFLGKNGENCRSDYILLSPSSKDVLIIELKKTNDQGCNIINQMKGSYCVLLYIEAIIDMFFNDNPFNKKKIFYVAFVNITRKMPLKEKEKPTPNTDPEHPRKISSASAQYKSLLIPGQHGKKGR